MKKFKIKVKTPIAVMEFELIGKWSLGDIIKYFNALYPKQVKYYCKRG